MEIVIEKDKSKSSFINEEKNQILFVYQVAQKNFYWWEHFREEQLLVSDDIYGLF